MVEKEGAKEKIQQEGRVTFSTIRQATLEFLLETFPPKHAPTSSRGLSQQWPSASQPASTLSSWL